MVVRNYEIVKPIGKGKFAVVYNARKIDSGETVAFKRISVNMMDDKSREKCLKEVRLLQSLHHPNIIQYLDSFIEANDLIIIVEWAAAGDLKRQLRKMIEKKSYFEERIIWKYFAQICDAIQHMHNKRIMHRDLKPANIFLTLEGIVKVGDLGLSRELSENTIQAHSKVGTPLYMSPEVLRGDGYGFQSDIWSLGCLLYELANLKSPFKSEGLNLYSLFQKISVGEYELLAETYSEDLRQLAYSMITIQPDDRPSIEVICAKANQMRLSTANEKGKGKKKASEDSGSVNVVEEGKRSKGPLASFQNMNFEEFADKFIQPSPRANLQAPAPSKNTSKAVTREGTATKHDGEDATRHDRVQSPEMHNGRRRISRNEEVKTPERSNGRANRVNDSVPSAYLIGRDFTEDDQPEDHQARNRESAKADVAAVDASALASSIALHGKLETLCCPVKRLYRHLHFATRLSHITGKQVVHNQFKLFVDTMDWVYGEIDCKLKGSADEESPVVTAKRLLVTAQVNHLRSALWDFDSCLVERWDIVGGDRWDNAHLAFECRCSATL